MLHRVAEVGSLLANAKMGKKIVRRVFAIFVIERNCKIVKLQILFSIICL